MSNDRRDYDVTHRSHWMATEVCLPHLTIISGQLVRGGYRLVSP